MKLSLVALGTAAALTVSSLSAPAFAAEPTTTPASTTPSASPVAGFGLSSGDTDKDGDTAFDLSSGDTDKDGGKFDLEALNGWITIITAVIGVIGSIMSLGK